MSANNPRKRGRPATVNSDVVISVILSHKNIIVREDGGIVSKLNEVWTTIAKELNYIKDERSLYTFVMCNKFGVRHLLTNKDNLDTIEDNVINDTTNTVTDDSNTSLNLSNEIDKTAVSFDIHVPRSEIDKLIITKEYSHKGSKKGPQVRTYTKFCPGEWQHLLSEKIRTKTHSQCGYNYKWHSISRDGNSGQMAGHCHCGSTIKCFLQSDGSDVTTIRCTTTKGNGTCSKRPLRAPIRSAVGEELRQKSVCVYRAEKADILMREGDPEPPILPNAAVLRNAKHEYAASFFVHRDPIQAIYLMQLHSMKYVIHDIGLSPFRVIYSTNHQNSIYRNYARNENSCIAIDATGSIIKPIIRPDKSKSRSIFLYICVIRSEFGGQLPVAQMLSEKHNTNVISFWLREWIEKPGLPRPKEIVCDASKALLTAAIRAFTNFSTIQDYADACKDEHMPQCYIRIDVAHFMKMWANSLKDLRPQVKKFYLASIGQIILSCDIDRARQIIYAILVIARSNTEGNTANGGITSCEKQKNFLSRILTSNETDEIIDINDDQVDEMVEDDHEETPESSKWFGWAQDINNSVLQEIDSDEGMRINAHYYPALADRLIRDLKWLPLWSCVARNKFGYGRIPASSAIVESEFKNIKLHLLHGETLPMRADQFIVKHVSHIDGTTKLAAAATIAAKISSPVPTEQNDSVSCQDIVLNKDPQQESQPTVCPVCANGDEPTGAHTCFICHIAVHAIAQCSIPFDDEEGYGQRRICAKCRSQKNVPDIIASRELEDWGGLAKPVIHKSRPGRYLQQKYGANEFILDENIKKIPFLRNGGDVILKPIRLEDKTYTLGNTCAFDSTFQIFLTAASDNSSFRNWIENFAGKHDFFQMILKVLSEGLNALTYRSRCKILLPIYEKSSEKLNTIHLRCEITIADLCRKLFKSVPSFQDQFVCSRNCTPITNNLGLVMITQSSLLDEEYNSKIEGEISLPQDEESRTKCKTAGCSGDITKSLQAPGNFIIFEVMPDEGIIDNTPVALGDIPKTLQLSFMSEQYVLAGVAHFKNPRTRTSGGDDDAIKIIGHYTGLCNRRGTWIEFDDTKGSGKRQPIKREISLHLVVYVR